MKKLIILIVVLVCIFPFSGATYAEEFLEQPENYTVYVTNENGLNYYKSTGSMNNFGESHLVLQGTYQTGEKIKIGREYPLENMYAIIYDNAYHNSDTTNFIYVKVSEIGQQSGFMDSNCINFNYKIDATVLSDEGVEIFKGPQIDLFESTGTIIPKNTQIEMYEFKRGYNNREGNKYWRYVKYNGIEGYIHIAYGEVGIEQTELISTGTNVYKSLKDNYWSSENIITNIPLNTIIKDAWVLPAFGIDGIYYVEYNNIKGYVYGNGVGVPERYARFNSDFENTIIICSSPYYDNADILYSGEVTSGEIIKVKYIIAAYEEEPKAYVTYNGVSGWIGRTYYSSTTNDYLTRVISPDGCPYYLYDSNNMTVSEAGIFNYNEIINIAFYYDFLLNDEKYIRFDQDHSSNQYVIKYTDLKKLDVAKYFLSEEELANIKDDNEVIANDTKNNDVIPDNNTSTINPEKYNNDEVISINRKHITIFFAILITIILILIIIVTFLLIKNKKNQ